MIVYAALALISAAALAYEVLLVRLFAIAEWHHFAFMAISIALLGFGASGSVLAVIQGWAKPRFTAVFAAAALAFGLSAPIGFLLAQALPFNALAVIWEPGQLLYLPAMYLLLVVPFFCAGSCIALAFVCGEGRMGRVYAYNLVGSAVGALGVIAALFLFDPAETLRLVAVLGFLAAAVVALHRRELAWRGLSAIAVTLGVAVWAIAPAAWFDIEISFYKGLPKALEASGAELLRERSSPLGLLSVVRSPEVPFRYLPGLSLNAPATPPEQLGVFIDGGGMTAINRFDGERESLRYLDYTTDALPYHLLSDPETLVLGAGGGRGVLQAVYHRAPRIDAVELDPNIMRLVRQDFADFAGHLYARPEIEVHVAEARAFVESTRRRWDLMQIPLLDAAGTAAAGVQGLSESYVYTVEAFVTYLERLKPGGWLAITRWLKLPPRDSLKLFATAVAAMERQNLTEPERSLILLRGLNTSTLLVKKGEVTAAEIAEAESFAEARSFDLAYYPGIEAAAANRFNVLEEPYFYDGAMALVGEAAGAFSDNYKFDIAPPSDDRPYFFDFLKWRALPEMLEIRKAGGPGLLELGGVVLAATLVQAIALGTLLILAPLAGHRRDLGRPMQRWRVVGYFLALGLAFLFVEIAFIQKFILFLGHPLYAVSVVLTAFLLFAGLGSSLSQRLARRFEVRASGGSAVSAIQLSAAVIIALSLLYLLLLPPAFAALQHLADMAKIALSLLLIAPLAFFMGMPFPLGLARVWESAPNLVPWAWGVNGCASVISTLLATLIAMELGFSTVVFVAAALYACAAAIFLRPLAAA